MAKKSKSRLRAIFGSLRAKGKLLKQTYSLRKKQKAYNKLRAANKQFADIYKKSYGGITSYDKETQERLAKEIDLMKQVGLWKEKPTLKDKKERLKLLNFADILEREVRKDVEGEYKQKIGVKDLINVASGSFFTSTRKPKYDIDYSLADADQKLLEKAGTQLLNIKKPKASERIEQLRSMIDTGKLTEGEGQHLMQRVLKQVEKRKEKRKELKRMGLLNKTKIKYSERERNLDTGDLVDYLRNIS